MAVSTTSGVSVFGQRCCQRCCLCCWPVSLSVLLSVLLSVSLRGHCTTRRQLKVYEQTVEIGTRGGLCVDTP
jgi:hypothetical protein